VDALRDLVDGKSEDTLPAEFKPSFHIENDIAQGSSTALLVKQSLMPINILKREKL